MYIVCVCVFSEGGVRRRIGALGSAYLTLQLYLLALLAVYTLLSLVVILPVNISGKQRMFKQYTYNITCY